MSAEVGRVRSASPYCKRKASLRGWEDGAAISRPGPLIGGLNGKRSAASSMHASRLRALYEREMSDDGDLELHMSQIQKHMPAICQERRPAFTVSGGKPTLWHPRG